MLIKKRNKVFLVGPFIGELSWEFYRFAPYIIHLKKENPTKKIIVFTRPSRFDLYGVYADILVPLKLINDDREKQIGFTIEGFTGTSYSLLSKAFTTKYRKRFKVIDHIHPDISRFYYKLKWQYPRSLMDYDFKPRIANSKYVEKYSDRIVFYNDLNERDSSCLKEYDVQFSSVFFEETTLTQQDGHNITYLGCLIELIRKCKFVVSSFDSYIAHLSLLLKTPVIIPVINTPIDAVKLCNPFKTPFIICKDTQTGVEYYENNF